MSTAKVVHLTTVHPALDIRIFHKICKSLVGEGFQVTLLAPHHRNEVVDGVRIRALVKPRLRVRRMLRATGEVLRMALRENADLYHFHVPELLFTGIALKMCGKKVIYDVQENYPAQLLSKHYLPPQSRRALGTMVGLVEKVGMNVFDRIIVANPSYIERFPANKTISLENFASLAELDLVQPVPYHERPPLIVYVGALNLVRGVREMIEVVNRLPAKYGARLALAGNFQPESLEAEIRNTIDLSRTDLLGYQTRHQVAGLLSRARVGLAVLHPIPNYLGNVGTKLYEYMTFQVPFVASDFPVWRAVDTAGAGEWVDPLNVAQIAEKTEWILGHPDEAAEMARRGHQTVRNKYNWESEEKKLFDLYRGLLGQN